MVFGQKWPFWQLLFFFQNRPRKCVLRYSRTKKKAFLGYKKKKFKKSKNCNFSKGVNPWFWQKNGHFSNSFLRQNRPGKCILQYSRTNKMPLYPIKARRSKRGKIDIFPKGLTHDFGPKMAIFPTFFFRQYRQGKRVLRYSRTKKRLSRL